MIPVSSDHLIALHRGFATERFDELPQPTRPFQLVRTAAHIDLPLEIPARALHPPQPQPRGWPRPIPFVDKAASDAAHALRAQTERQRELMQSAHSAGHDRGLVEGYWRGARHGALAGVVLGALLAGLVTGLRVVLLP